MVTHGVFEYLFESWPKQELTMQQYKTIMMYIYDHDQNISSYNHPSLLRAGLHKQSVDTPIFGVEAVAVVLVAIARTAARIHVSEVRRGSRLTGRDVKAAQVVLRKPLPFATGIFVCGCKLAIFLVHVRRDAAGTSRPAFCVVVAVVVVVDTCVANGGGDAVVRNREIHAPRVLRRGATDI